MSLDAITNVLFLGVPLQEVLSLVNLSLANSSGSIPEWYVKYCFHFGRNIAQCQGPGATFVYFMSMMYRFYVQKFNLSTYDSCQVSMLKMREKFTRAFYIFEKGLSKSGNPAFFREEFRQTAVTL